MDKNIKPKEKTLKISLIDDFNLSTKEIVLKSQYIDGIELKELLNTFRQFLVMLTYPEETAKRVVLLEEGDMEDLGLTMRDLSITDV